MQAKKIFLFFLIIINSQFLIINSLHSQEITADTTLANKHFETGKEYYKNKIYDTATVNFEKASIL